MKLNKTDLSQIFKYYTIPEDFVLDTARISTDTRKIMPEDSFFAIKGEAFNGNDFIKKAISKGARTVLCQNTATTPKNLGKTVVFTFHSDRETLRKIAELNLDKSDALRFAITGSNGKTTTKEILATLLSSRFNTLKTLGNFNNDIGLPLTLFKLTPNHKAIAIELGMSALGEIDSLASLVKPKWSIITNVQRAHLSHLGTLENIATAKCEIIPHTTGASIINADSTALMNKVKTFKNPILYFSTETESDIFLKRLVSENLNSSTFVLRDNIHNEDLEITLPLPGKHNIANFIPAFLAARLSGIDSSSIVTAVKEIKPFEGRYSIETIKDITVINDCYNANPDSMKIGLSNFSKIKAARKIVLLGDMFELGQNEEKMHYEIGQFLTTLQIDNLITFGKLAENIAHGAKLANTNSFMNFNELLEHLKKTLKKDDYLYIKSSNALTLNRVCKELKTFLE